MIKLLRRLQLNANNLRMWIRYRTTDKYHVVKTELEPGYYDTDYRMLFANFALLVEFVEKELSVWHPRDTLDTVDDTEEPEYQEAVKRQNAIVKEIYTLYDWWKARESKQDEQRQSLGSYPRAAWPGSWRFDNEYQDTPEYKAWKRWCDDYLTLKETWDNEDTENLKKLIDLRHHLWT